MLESDLDGRAEEFARKKLRAARIITVFTTAAMEIVAIGPIGIAANAIYQNPGLLSSISGLFGSVMSVLGSSVIVASAHSYWHSSIEEIRNERRYVIRNYKSEYRNRTNYVPKLPNPS